MSNERALAYPRNVTYNFSRWSADEPVSLVVEGARHYGKLKNPHGQPPYQVELTEVLEFDSIHRIPPRTIEIDDLGQLSFLHHHGHA